MPSAQNAQALPSIDPGLRPSHYRTILPNLSYPYSPNSHILCSGSSAPLLFSVSQTFFFMLVIRLTPFALRKPRVLVWRQPPLLPPVYKLVMLFFFQRDRKSDTNVIRHYVQAPSSANMCFYTCSVPDVFQGISVWIRVRLTIILSTFFSWFLSFLSLAWRITCQRLFENSNWFGKNFLALDSWVLLPPPRIFEFVRTLRFLSC